MQAGLITITLAIMVAGLLGAAAGYHLRPRIVQVTGGDDEAVILQRLNRCEEKLTEISQQLRHAQQVADLYMELYERSKNNS